MPTLSKKSGIAGLPAGVKEAGRRVDFKPDDFTLLIETKGYRLAWSRASMCPCDSNNTQTEQPNPNCALCEGGGWVLFAPAIPPDTSVVGALDTTQKALVGTTHGVIMGIMTSFFGKELPYDAASRRLEGKVNLTVRPENRLGYYDQLINLDTTVVYSQVVKADGTSTVETRYPVVEMNQLRSESAVLTLDVDYSLVAGVLTWVGAPPVADTLFAIHYLTYPHWRVIEHPHSTRSTPVKFKDAKPATPAGNPIEMPVQAVCQYEWLVS